MIVSQGTVYTTEESASFPAHTADDKGRGGPCQCTVEPVWELQPEPAAVRDLQEQWAAVTSGVVGSAAQRIAWRRYWRTRDRDVEGKPARIDEPDRAQQARDRQTQIDQSRPVAEALSEVDELVDNQASDAAFAHRIRSQVKRGVLTEEQAARLAASRRDPDALNAAIEDIATANGLRRVSGRAGDVVPFNPDMHTNIGSGDLRGKFVRIVRPGYAMPGLQRQPWDTGTGPQVVLRAAVEEATPDEAALARRRT